MKLTWDDLMIAQVPETELREYLRWFAPIMPQGAACRTVFFNRVGEWFVKTPDHAVHKISNISGASTKMAATYEEFTASVNLQAWQEEHLRSLDVMDWKEGGCDVAAGQVYAFVPHPAVNGGCLLGQIMPMDLRLWLWISAQSLGLAV